MVAALVVELDGDAGEPLPGPQLDERLDRDVAPADAFAVVDSLGPVIASRHEQGAAERSGLDDHHGA